MSEIGAYPKRSLRRRIAMALGLIVLVLVAIFALPMINVGRYRLRVAQGISEAIGRPVHIDNITLSMLPTPGLTLENFVISEDPEFGSEPVMRANQVHVTLRLSSLWRRKLEASSISLTEPSVNLVRAENGRWNLQAILMHATQVDAAPTAQPKAGAKPRFPYIEATSARVNLKLGNEKTPFSLTEAEFALWLPNPDEWRIRLEAHPSRTDTDASDTGVLRVEGTLKHAESFSQVPIDLHGVWTKAQLGETSKVLIGADAGLRGTLEWGANVKGTFAESNVQTWIKLDGLRRAEFFPAQPISAEIRCGLRATNRFLTLEEVKCEAPVDAGAVALTGRIDDVREPEKAAIQLGLRQVAADTLLNWGKVASSRVSPQWAASGTVDADLTYGAVSGWKGHLTANKLGLTAKNHEVIKDRTVELTDAAVTPVVFKGRPGLKPENSNLQGDLRRYAFTFDRLPAFNYSTIEPFNRPPYWAVLRLTSSTCTVERSSGVVPSLTWTCWGESLKTMRVVERERAGMRRRSVVVRLPERIVTGTSTAA
ncbi:AsmA family protein [Terriglobus sp. YAF25]|uniref:AsmA family protein n=1 Tax=Terriglobus sp. YAF25 TaxID=3233080 RepID=UPI003F9A0B82